MRIWQVAAGAGGVAMGDDRFESQTLRLRGDQRDDTELNGADNCLGDFGFWPAVHLSPSEESGKDSEKQGRIKKKAEFPGKRSKIIVTESDRIERA
jgi:hypothetical protein